MARYVFQSSQIKQLSSQVFKPKFLTAFRSVCVHSSSDEMTAKSYPLEVNLELDSFRTKLVHQFVNYSESFADFETNVRKVLKLINPLKFETRLKFAESAVHVSVYAHTGTHSLTKMKELFDVC